MNGPSYRTDRNNNPTAFTTELASQAGLNKSEYTQGDSFTSNGITYYTAKLLINPVALTIAVIDKLGFYTMTPKSLRWSYIAMPYELWLSLTQKQKEYTIGIMYQTEGGTEMINLFPTSPE
jgi:hypothetical protein